VRYRADKSYPWLAVTLDERSPALAGDAWPKAQGRALLRAVLACRGNRETLDLLISVFLTCNLSAGRLKRAQQVGRPCLFGYIDKAQRRVWAG